MYQNQAQNIINSISITSMNSGDQKNQVNISRELQFSISQISPQDSLSIQGPPLQQQDIINEEQPIPTKNLQKCVGMVRAVWRNSKTGKEQYINYGTAFAVSPQLILTCAHNIFNEEINAIATQIIFVPGHNGYIDHSTKQYSSIKGQYYQFIPLKEEESMVSLPTVNQICLVALETPIPKKRFVELALCLPQPFDKAVIIGYPSRQYAKTVNLNSISLSRKILNGEIASIKSNPKKHYENILDYTMKTRTGMSGSPILYRDKDRNKVVAIGIHTHSGDGQTNRGIYFNSFALQTIKQFEENLHKNLKIPKRICFNQIISLPPQPSPPSFSHPTQQTFDEVYNNFYTSLQMDLSPQEIPPQNILHYPLNYQFFNYSQSFTNCQ